MDSIHEHGYWFVDDARHHVFDKKLCEGILEAYPDVETVVDVGCGMGDYTRAFISKGIQCTGYDGNPCTSQLTEGLCDVKDFAVPVDFGVFDLVLCLEVGEHISKEYEQVFLDNITKASKKYLLLTWGLEGQPGWGHVNGRSNEYIISEVKKRGFRYEPKKSQFLRETAEHWWFKSTIMAYAK